MMASVVENDDSSPVVASDTAPFRFLDLPPEIRNRIYAFAAVSPGLVRMCPRSLVGNRKKELVCREPGTPWKRANSSEGRHLKADNPEDSTSSSSVAATGSLTMTNSPTKDSRMAFTQVCRLIRTEFNPLFVAQFDVQIPILELETYIEYLKACDFSIVPRRLEIHIERGIEIVHIERGIEKVHIKSSIEKVHKGVDILPLLLLRTSRKDFTCGFDLDPDSNWDYLHGFVKMQYTDRMDSLNSVFKIRDPLWDEALIEGVFKEIVLIFGKHLGLAFEFADGYVPHFVGEKRLSTPDEGHESIYRTAVAALKFYLRGIGFTESCDTGVYHETVPTFLMRKAADGRKFLPCLCETFKELRRQKREGGLTYTYHIAHPLSDLLDTTNNTPSTSL